MVPRLHPVRRATARSAALGLTVVTLACTKVGGGEPEHVTMGAAAEAVLRVRGYCPAPPGRCGGYNLFHDADGGRTVDLAMYAIPDPAAVAEVFDSCVAISLRSPRRPPVRLRVYRLPHWPPDRHRDSAGSATEQSPVYTLTMRHG